MKEKPKGNKYDRKFMNLSRETADKIFNQSTLMKKDLKNKTKKKSG